MFMHKTNFFRRLLATGILCAAFLPMIAGEAYSYGQIFSRMANSPVLYIMSFAEEPFVTPQPPKVMNGPDLYQVKVGKDLMQDQYRLDNEAYREYELAEEYFAKQDLKNAIKHYKAALKRHPTNAMLQCYLGQSYRMSGDFKQAKKCFEKAIKNNYHSYMAHWFLANVHMYNGDLSKAVEEIATAKVLNRNNPILQEHFEAIMERAGRRSRDYYFIPQVNITGSAADSVLIKATLEWMPYGIVEAMWQHEPDWHVNERLPEGYFNFNKAAEFYVVLNTTYANTKEEHRQDPMLGFLAASAANNLPREFVVYEMVLPNDPNGVYQLPRADIEGMVKYLLTVKHPKL